MAAKNHDIKMADDAFGPILPPHLRKKKESVPEQSSKNSDERRTIVGPTRPPEPQEEVVSSSIGPSIPPEFLAQLRKKNQETESIEPVEPPKAPSIGPSIPAAFLAQLKEKGHLDLEEEDEEEVFGPLPVGDTREARREVQYAYADAARSRREEEDALQKESRESWMTELPDVFRAPSSVVARGFRQTTKEVNQDERNDIWTSVPNNASSSEHKSKKRKKDDDMYDRGPSERDIVIQQQIDQYNKAHRPKSLMELHKEKMAKEAKTKKKSNEPAPYTPFNRETDLKIDRIDRSRTKELIEHASSFGTRFASARKY